MLPLISGSSAFSKSRLNIWNFWVHVLLKAGLENFENYFAWIWNECNYAVFEHLLALPFLGTGMKTYLFQSCGHCCVFQICWHIECSTLAALSFRIWNSSAGNPSPPLALPFPGGSDCEESSWNAGNWIPSLSQEDPLEKEMATHSSILAWKIPWMEEPGWLQSMGSWGHYWVTNSLFH